MAIMFGWGFVFGTSRLTDFLQSLGCSGRLDSSAGSKICWLRFLPP
ncbi:hypothetical protein AALP_AA7G087200 [Arabis alpina]|uniref:Uncharacterized protein n=1 Tax=Arabis alpina TaxID=50452 RepID=A0A087GGT5_ARAAL|nr:hypothetical protein AALP_AA7G087200 [Arabis alpina]